MAVYQHNFLQRNIWPCLVGFLVLMNNCLQAQYYSGIEPSLLFKQFHASKPDSGRVQLLLQISSFYLYKRGNTGKNLDSAFILAEEASELSDRLKLVKGRDEALFLTGMVYIKQHSNEKIVELLKDLDTTTQIAVMLEMIRYNTVIWGLRSKDIETAKSFASRSLELSQLLHSPELVSQCYLQLSNLYYEMGDYSKGKDFFLKTLSRERKTEHLVGEAQIFSQSTGNLGVDESLLDELLVSQKRLISLYPKITIKETFSKILDLIVMGHDQLSYYYIHKGNLDKALYYSLETIKMFENNHDSLLSEYPYQTIGKIYLDLGKLEQSLEYFLTAHSIVSRKGDFLDAVAIKNMTRAYLGLNRPQEALAFLDTITRHGSYEDDNTLSAITESIGNCYFAIKQYNKAEKCYLESLRHNSKSGYRTILLAHVPLAKLYVITGQYDKARPYLYELTSDSNKAIVPVSVQRDNQLLLFEADSASKDFLSAISHLRLYKMLNDSIFNEKRNSQIEALKLQYETDRKDKDLQLKEQNIQLLTKQGELQAAALQRTRFVRNVVISGMTLLFILLGMVYTRYRFKQKTNQLLQLKQDEINERNRNLWQLNLEQKKLLTEKEWLVKEIHHRVKNNLQMIISLLNAQSEFLDHPTALSAIRASRERMQAISLIHQKLYQPDNGTLINMNSYVREMVHYLAGSFDDAERIKFELNIDEINLDVSQSIPLGLILNEAITNAVKYAFAPGEQGRITISLKNKNEHDVVLNVCDNGNGFPESFKFTESNSLGVQLIQLFAEQLEADLQFNSTRGVQILLNFKRHYPLSGVPSFARPDLS